MNTIFLKNNISLITQLKNGSLDITAKDEKEQYDKKGNFIKYTNSGLIAYAIKEISKENYSALIHHILQGLGGLGGELTNIYFNKDENFALFTHEVKKDCETEISYYDSIKLFTIFFKNFKNLVEKESTYIQQEINPYTKKPWYPEFLEQLEKLNKLYDEMVQKGEIVED